MKYIYGWILLASTLATTHSAANTLLDIYQKSLKHDPSWAATVEEYRAAKEIVNQGRAELLPSMNAEGTATRNHNHLKGFVNQHFESLAAGATLTQPILTLSGRSIFKKSQATANRADAKFAADLQAFIIKVSETYFGVLRAEESLRFAKGVEEAITQQLAQARERFDVGLIPVTDVYEVQSARDLARVNLIVAENELAIAKESLETLTGEHFESVNSLMEAFPIKPPQPDSAAQWEQKAITQNFDIIQSEFSKQEALSEVKIRRHADTPTLDAFATYRYSDSDQVNNVLGSVRESPATEQITYGLRMDWPLFQGGAINSRVREASYQHEAAKDAYENAHKLVIQETRNFYRTVLADVSAVNARKQGIRSASSALEATKAGYEVGTRNVVDVLDAQQVLFAAQRDYASARYDYVLNTLRLSALAGELSESKLQELNHWLVAKQSDSPSKAPSKGSKPR